MLATNQILNNDQVRNIIKRIAFQIYEVNADESEIILAGIQKNGFLFAKKLKIQLEKISPIKAVLCEVTIDKKEPLKSIRTSLSPEEFRDKSILLADDVLNSGSTLIYGVRHFLQVPVKQIKTVVLVDRDHKRYPVKADFKGIALSTSLNENVAVIFEKDNDRAILE